METTAANKREAMCVSLSFSMHMKVFARSIGVFYELFFYVTFFSTGALMDG